MFMHLVAIEPAEHVATDTEPQDTPDVVSDVPAVPAEPVDSVSQIPETPTTAPAVPASIPVRVESDAHREWTRARDTFIAQHTSHSELRELSPEQRQILFATIGDEPPYSTQEG